MAEASGKLRREVLEEQRKSRTRHVLALLLVFLLALCFFVFRQYRTSYTYENYTVTSEMLIEGQEVQYHGTGTSLIVATNDGAKSLSGTGKTEWELSYRMDHPMVWSCEAITAIADIGGKDVYVVAQNGIPYHYQVLYPIVKLAVASQGVTAVLLNNGSEDYIQLYDINGSMRVDLNTKTKTDGFPIDVALSKDGQKLVTLYLTFENDALISKVTFYNAGEVGKNHIGNVVGQRLYGKNRLVTGVQFIDNDTVCIKTEDGFSLYRMKETPKLISEKTFEDSLYDLECTENGILAVTENAVTKKKKMLRFQTDGRQIAAWEEIMDYERVVASEQEVLLFSPQKAIVYRNNKTEKFVTEFERNLERMFTAGENRYFLIDTGRVQTIKLTRTKEAQ